MSPQSWSHSCAKANRKYIHLLSFSFPFHVSVILIYMNTDTHVFFHSRNATWHMTEMTLLLKADLLNAYVLVMSTHRFVRFHQIASKYLLVCAVMRCHMTFQLLPKLTKFAKINSILWMLTCTGALHQHFYASLLFSFQTTTKAASHSIGEWRILEARC